MHVFEVENLDFKSFEFRLKNCVTLFAYIFSIAFFKDCALSAISFKTFIFNCVLNKLVKK